MRYTNRRILYFNLLILPEIWSSLFPIGLSLRGSKNGVFFWGGGLNVVAGRSKYFKSKYR